MQDNVAGVQMRKIELPIIVKPDVGVSTLKSVFTEVLPVASIPIILIISWVVTGVINIMWGGLIGIMLILIFSVKPALTALNTKATTYKIDREGVYFFEGFFTKREKFLPMEKATDVRLIQRWPFDIWYNTGTIVIETAGRSSTLGLRTLPEPRKYYEALKSLILKR